MFNPYIIVLVLFAIVGVLVSTWGWAIIAKARKTRHWPNVEGMIEECEPASDVDDLLPHIVYRYTVSGQSYRRVLEFPGSVSPSKEFTAAYTEKFPAGAKVPVYYDPAQPDHAILEPGIGSDWMILALGIIMTLFAVGALFFSG